MEVSCINLYVFGRCWSYVGKFGGAQIVSLQAPDEKGPNCLGSEGRAIHELLHALGLFHEQSRADRDKFVKIQLENVLKGHSLHVFFLHVSVLLICYIYY